MNLPLDPELPPMFFNTPNENRTHEELETWWDRPFASTLEDGTFDVYCLHGGAWDRPSWLGNASTLDAAAELAEIELSRWKEMRSRPTTKTLEDDSILVVRAAQRPDQQDLVLGKCLTLVQAFEMVKRLQD